MSDHDPLRREAETAAGPAPDLPPEEVVLADGSIEHPRVGYQRDRTPLAIVISLMAVTLAYAGLNYMGVLAFFDDRERDERAYKASPRPAALRPADRLPAEPRLEQLDRKHGVAAAGVNRQFTVEEAFLESYGPTREEGFVHVPIGRAMDYLVGRVPVRKPPSEQGPCAIGVL